MDVDWTDGNIALLAAVMSIRELSTASRVTVFGLPVKASAYVYTFERRYPLSISNQRFRICNMKQLDGVFRWD
jgi:hypothetical protein